jgi:hypothetical protein
METFNWIWTSLLVALWAAAFYSTTKGGKFFELFQVSGDPLTEPEQSRLDKLLASGKRYHNLGILLSGILLALSALENFREYVAPFGDIVIPSAQTATGLYLLVILALIATDRFFAMAYPWLPLDRRRPPYDWIVMGLAVEKKYRIGIWFYLPLLVSSVALTIVLKEEAVIAKSISMSSLLLSGVGLVYSPRIISYYVYLLSERLDHRGGSATYSIYLLYWYRLLRQVIFFVYVGIPLLIAVPRWRTPQFETFVQYLTWCLGILYIIRQIAGTKKIYRWIDRQGPKRGFPLTSDHYG